MEPLSGRARPLTLRSYLLPILLIPTLGLTLMYLTNFRMANTYFSQFGSPTGSNVNGVWIGVLDTFDHPVVPSPFDAPGFNPPRREPVKMRSAMLLNLHVTDSFLDFYKGHGSFYTEGQPDIRKLDTVEFDVPEGVVTGQIMTYRDPAGPRGYEGHQRLTGTMAGGVITLTDVDFSTYGYRGQLHHGTVAEFEQLCRSLGYTGSPQNNQ